MALMSEEFLLIRQTSRIFMSVIQDIIIMVLHQQNMYGPLQTREHPGMMYPETYPMYLFIPYWLIIIIPLHYILVPRREFINQLMEEPIGLPLLQVCPLLLMVEAHLLLLHLPL